MMGKICIGDIRKLRVRVKKVHFEGRSNTIVKRCRRTKNGMNTIYICNNSGSSTVEPAIKGSSLV